MVLYSSTIPDSKRFFKISELAGKRWPNVTEDEIYDWHDAGYKVPVAAEGYPQIVDTAEGNVWNMAPHCNEINLMAYWAFFPEFVTLPSMSPETFLEIISGNPYVDQSAIDRLKKIMEESPELFKAECLKNSFLMIETECSKGFAYNSSGVISCWEFYNEQGVLCPSRSFNSKAQMWAVSPVQIKKEELLIKASSVKFLEQIAPELTSVDFRVNDGCVFQTESEATVSTSDRGENTYVVMTQKEKPLETWGAIAEYLDCSVSTARRHYAGIVRYTPKGKAFIEPEVLDKYRSRVASKENRRKKM